MHTEHLQNVSPGLVIGGWLVSAAVASLIALALAGTGFVSDDVTAASTWWNVVAVIVGFFAGGFFAGFRAIQAPILHAIGIGLTSIVVWVVLNVFAALLFEGAHEAMTPQLAVALLFTQFVAAMIGALLGYNLALRGKPGFGEHEPV